MQEIITNSVTGEVTVRDFTAEEISAHTPDPAVVLAAWRTTARCSRMQGILAIGETRWATVLEYRATATWAEVVVIDDARDWFRNSETIQLFGWLLNLTEIEIDALFIAAAAITA